MRLVQKRLIAVELSSWAKRSAGIWGLIENWVKRCYFGAPLFLSVVGVLIGTILAIDSLMQTSYWERLARTQFGYLAEQNGSDAVSQEFSHFTFPIFEVPSFGQNEITSLATGLGTNDSAVLYAATLNNGVFESFDRGSSWTSIGLNNVKTQDLQVTPGQLYAATKHGIFVRDNESPNWTLSGMQNVDVRDLAISSEGVLYAGTENGVFRRAVAPLPWVRSGLSTSVNSIEIRSGGILFAATESGLFRSIDDGLNWERFGFEGTEVLQILDIPNNGLFTLTLGGIFKYTANSWQEIGSDIDDKILTIGLGPHIREGQSNELCLSSDVSPSNEQNCFNALIAGTTQGVRVLMSDGWLSPASFLLNRESVFSLNFNRTRNSIFAGTSRGIFVSEDGASTWSQAARLDKALTIALTDDQRILVGTPLGFFFSTDYGRTWVRLNTGLTQLSIQSLAVDRKNDVVYAATLGGGVFEISATFPSNNAWKPINQGLENPFVRNLLIVDERLVAGTAQGLFLLDRLKRYWERIASNISIDVRDLSSAGDQILFAGTSQGLYRSEMGAIFETWETTDINAEIHDISIHGAQILASSKSGLHRSIDLGRSWESLELADAEETIESVAIVNVPINAAHQEILYLVGTHEGLYSSSDLGQRWTEEESSVLAGITSLLWDDRAGLFVGSNNGLRWGAIIPPHTAVIASFVLPLSICLFLSGALFSIQHMKTGRPHKLTMQMSFRLFFRHSLWLHIESLSRNYEKFVEDYWEKQSLRAKILVLLLPIDRSFDVSDISRRFASEELAYPQRFYEGKLREFVEGGLLEVCAEGLRTRLYYYLSQLQSSHERDKAALIEAFRQENSARLHNLLQSAEEGLIRLIATEVDWSQTRTTSEIKNTLNSGSIYPSDKQINLNLAFLQDLGLLSAEMSDTFSTSQADLFEEFKARNPEMLKEDKRVANQDNPVFSILIPFFDEAGCRMRILDYNALAVKINEYSDDEILAFYSTNSPAQAQDIGVVHRLAEQIYEGSIEEKTSIIVAPDFSMAAISHANTFSLDKSFVIVCIKTEMIQRALRRGSCGEVLAAELRRYQGKEDLYNVSRAIPSTDVISFYGRGKIIELCLREIDRQQPISLLGLRKIGKTSLVWRLSEKLAEYCTAYIDLERITYDACWIYPAIIREFALNLTEKHGIDLDGILNLSGNGSPLELSAHQEKLTELGFNLFIDDLNSLTKACSHIEKRVRFVLFLDEIERILPSIEDPEGMRGFEEFLSILRGVHQQLGNFNFIVVSAHDEVNKIPRWTSGRDNPVFNMMKEFVVPPLENSECQQMIKGIGELMQICYEDEALSLIARETGGHPFLARQICSSMLKYDVANRNGGKLLIDVAKVQFAVEDYAIHDPMWQLRDIWERLDKDDRAILKAIACSDASANFDLVNSPEHERQLRKLEERHLLSLSNNGSPDHAIPLLAKWIRVNYA